MSIDHPDGLTGVVDEALLAGAMLKAHHRLGGPAEPAAVLNTEGGVLQALSLLRLVLLPQQIARHPGPRQLTLHVGEVRQRDRFDARLRGVQQRFEPRVVQFIRQRPTQACSDGATQTLLNGGQRAADAGGNLPRAQTRELQPQNLPDLPHGQHLLRHRRSLRFRQRMRP